MKDIQKIEISFTNNPRSAYFTLLANEYYNKKQYKNALKVCGIGLSYQPNNLIGQYLYAKTLLVVGKTYKAEQYLKKIVLVEPYHIRAILLLIEVMKYLNRSPRGIKKYISHANNLFPKHPKVIDAMKAYKIKIEKKKQGLHERKIIEDNNSFVYSDLLATKTMYNLLIKQKRYNHALAVLEVLYAKEDTNTFYIKEKNFLFNKINKGQDGNNK